MAMFGLGGGGATPTRAYLEMMKSSAVIDPIIEQIDWSGREQRKFNGRKFC